MLAPDAAPAPAAAVHAARAPTAIGVGEREFAIAVYRPRVHPGALKFTIRNLGEDVHDLVIRRKGKRVGGLTAAVKPGQTAALRLTLRRIGSYQLVCTIADHEARGMRATLRVVR
jgi:plastocyanin